MPELLRDVRVDATTKGFPAGSPPTALADIGARGWTLDDLPTPVLTLRESALAHNLALIAAYCEEHDVEIAPHGKTTMAPQLWARQLGAGAWGITAASVRQASLMARAGIPRILIANPVVDPEGIAWLADRLAEPGTRTICYVDSVRGVELLEDGLRRAAAQRPLAVLVELGHAGGRSGCRSVPEAIDLADRVHRSPRLALAGVAGYEGTVCAVRSEACEAAVRAFLDDLGSLAESALRLSARGPDDRENGPIVSAGGSAYFDLVVERLAGRWSDVRILLRSGCSLTHDALRYQQSSPLAPGRAEPSLREAIEVWGTVLSRPEPDLAILDVGRRDVSFDQGMPIPTAVRGRARLAKGDMTVSALDDQHAYCRLDPDVRLEVGDRVVCGISHPCTALDKWRTIPVLDDRDRVVDGVATYF